MLNPILTHTGDIVNNIFAGDPLVFWGMTGATGSLFNEQKFCTLTDLESPFFTSCPTDLSIIISPETSCNSIVNYIVPSATDNCGTATTSQISGLSSGSVFPTGKTTNTFVATDLAGNTDTCSFDVIVTGDEKLRLAVALSKRLKSPFPYPQTLPDLDMFTLIISPETWS